MKRLFFVLAAILCLLLCGCSDIEVDSPSLSVVVTAFPHYDFARQLTKDVENIEIKMLISPGNEIHSYEPSPSDVLALSSCDLFIYTGGESDVWAKGILEQAQNKEMKVVSFMEICAPDGTESHDHEDGHDHREEYDEHVWTLPVMSEAICEEIARRLCEISPENAEKYNANLEEYLGKLGELDREFSGIFQNAKRDYIVVADRFPFYHLATHYKLKYFSAYSGCSSSTEPSAKVIASLAEKVKSDSLPYVFTIEFSNGKIANSIISGTDTATLTLHSCHNVSKEDFEGGVTYYDLMKQNAENLRKALCE